MGLLPASPRESLLPLELEEALEQRCPVMMEYLDGRAKRTHRIIQPLHIRRSSGELILIAHCHLREDRRTFKLDRIVQLSRIPGQAPPPAVVIENRVREVLTIGENTPHSGQPGKSGERWPDADSEKAKQIEQPMLFPTDTVTASPEASESKHATNPDMIKG